MINIFETELSNNKVVLVALTRIYGINIFQSSLICKSMGFAKNFKLADISEDQLFRLASFIESADIILSSDLKKRNNINFNKILHLKLYKGLRKLSGLPVRGQRTHTNSKTAKKLNKKRILKIHKW